MFNTFFDSQKNDLKIYGQEFNQGQTNFKSDDFKGTVTDFRGVKANCYALLGSDQVNRPFSSCLITGPGPYLYGIDAKLNLENAFNGGLPVTQASSWNLNFDGLRGYKVVSLKYLKGTTGLVVFRKEADGNIGVDAEFVVGLFMGDQKMPDVGKRMALYAYWTGEELGMTGANFDKFYFNVDDYLQKRALVYNIGGDGQGIDSQIQMKTIGEFKFAITDYTKISPSKDSLSIVGLDGKEVEVDLKGLMISDKDPAGEEEAMMSTGLKPRKESGDWAMGLFGLMVLAVGLAVGLLIRRGKQVVVQDETTTQLLVNE